MGRKERLLARLSKKTQGWAIGGGPGPGRVPIRQRNPVSLRVQAAAFRGAIGGSDGRLDTKGSGPRQSTAKSNATTFWKIDDNKEIGSTVMSYSDSVRAGSGKT